MHVDVGIQLAEKLVIVTHIAHPVRHIGKSPALVILRILVTGIQVPVPVLAKIAFQLGFNTVDSGLTSSIDKGIRGWLAMIQPDDIIDDIMEVAGI